ncbi:GTP-binding protein REM 1-like [Schistocerca nitens]|uniref:GTP-binding protein REM 1-like n=1 Tax=Schistocerca nitens TaxID=7011 RepID=UPI002119666B|nr:GTP-binding protein REM 1-like [Schistocerca nitens]
MYLLYKYAYARRWEDRQRAGSRRLRRAHEEKSAWRIRPALFAEEWRTAAHREATRADLPTPAGNHPPPQPAHLQYRRDRKVESYCTTYNPDVFVVVYSVVDRKTLKAAEDILLFLWKNDYVALRGVILVGNKADLERRREVPMAVGRKLANSCGCKFIETSSGLDHNVDELLVGILAQVQLNPHRDRHKLRKDKKLRSSGRRLLRHLLGIRRQARSCENLLVL